MKIKLYVSWQDERILREKEYEEAILEAAKYREENEDDEFAEFLDNYLSQNCRCRGCDKLVYLFNLSEEKRKEILKLWKKDCLEMARYNFPNDYEEIEIEV